MKIILSTARPPIKHILKSTGQPVLPLNLNRERVQEVLNRYGSKTEKEHVFLNGQRKTIAKTVPNPDIYHEMRIPINKPFLPDYGHYILPGNRLQLIHKSKISIVR